MREQTAMLPGMTPPDPHNGGPGPIEAGLNTALAELRAGGWVTDAHAHVVALAVAAAQRADRLSPREKAYGVAQVLTSVAKVFELLPAPDAVADAQWETFIQKLEEVGQS